MRRPARGLLAALAPALAVTFGLGTSAIAGPAPPSATAPPIVVVARDHAAWEAEVAARFGADAALSWDSFRSAPKALRRLDAATVGVDPASRALGFVAVHKALLGVPPAVDLTLKSATAFRDGVSVLLAQRLGDLVVEGRSVTVALDLRGHVRAVHLDPPPTGLAPTARDLGPAAAVAAVRARFGPLPTGRPTLVAYPLAAGPARPAWRVPVALLPLVAHFRVWIDAETGAVLAQAPAAADQLIRRLEVAR